MLPAAQTPNCLDYQLPRRNEKRLRNKAIYCCVSHMLPVYTEIEYTGDTQRQMTVFLHLFSFVCSWEHVGYTVTNGRVSSSLLIRMQLGAYGTYNNEWPQFSIFSHSVYVIGRLSSWEHVGYTLTNGPVSPSLLTPSRQLGASGIHSNKGLVSQSFLTPSRQLGVQAFGSMRDTQR